MSRTSFRVNLCTIVCLNIKELLARSRLHIWSLSDSNGIRTHKHLVRKQTLKHLVKLACLAKWLSVCLRAKWLPSYLCFARYCTICDSNDIWIHNHLVTTHNRVINLEINFIFLIKLLFDITKNSRQIFKYLENENRF